MDILCASLLPLSFLVNLIYGRKLQTSAAEPLQPTIDRPTPAQSVAVIIPAYNEAENIADCVRSVLQCESWTSEKFSVWVVDDQSTDRTGEMVRSLEDPRLHLITGEPRPSEEPWMGKNWACTQAVEQLLEQLKYQPDYLLFLDADVRLQPGAIATALQTAASEAIDLLTILPQVICGCWTEWIAQPLAVGIIAAGYRPNEINDPESDRVFAAGPFMFFKQTTYEALGGHRAIAAIVVEDIEFAKRIKFNKFKLSYRAGYELATVRMYRTGAALWEGWTKNYYLAMGRNLPSLLRFVLTAILFAIAPWAIFLAALGGLVSSHQGLLLGSSVILILMHYGIRVELHKVAKLPTNYWYLTGLGGILIVAIAFASYIKTETGWGWTWRGRSLTTAGLAEK